MTQELPIVRTEFATRMRKAMLDFSLCIDAPEVGMTEREWWLKFLNWQVERLEAQELEQWKEKMNGPKYQENSKYCSENGAISITRISDRERVFQLVGKSDESEPGVLPETK